MPGAANTGMQYRVQRGGNGIHLAEIEETKIKQTRSRSKGKQIFKRKGGKKKVNFMVLVLVSTSAQAQSPINFFFFSSWARWLEQLCIRQATSHPQTHIQYIQTQSCLASIE